MSRTALILPVRNAGRHLDRLLPALAAQSLRPDEWLALDSESSDGSRARLLAAGASVVPVRAADFNHGGTRRLASELTDAKVLIYLTQDAIPAGPDALRRLRDALLAEDDIGVAYGRQLPQPDAGLLGAHARRFNYPPFSRTKRLADAAELGIKTCFSSDSFAAYRREALREVGGFPSDVIGSEDAHVAGRMLLAGWAVRYEAAACVHHSHDYGLLEEMRRYFDIGVFYGRERWIAERFGRAGAEGRRFLRSELETVRRAGQPWRQSEVLLRCALKLAGYRLGHVERWLPRAFKRRLSMFPAYWK
ncbi:MULTISPECIES: glycosyltransferase family 2 protein [Chromobacterium]|uniref:glycosyltransferase family 2 protein n=1 Tax=Chromobacterium TaxID=535 RepID=UPI0018890370|nr:MULTISPECIES: glycosyltransferase family 2 protein [Chromobacterium]QOZ81943.1 glycosyltransferase family 2 protein [Chromobacterium sp. Rain0013]WON81944.1 glycosyltransferase family 2 protein [Chromobacterium haemolyticum]